MTTEPNDPTRAGAPVVGDAGARLTLPEIESLCMKAARGAGMDWGMAEEAGFAARWLAVAGLPGPELLLKHLGDRCGKPWSDVVPDAEAGHWRGKGGGPVCPIAAGAAVSDLAGSPPSTIRIENLSIPLLILPFLCLSAGGDSPARILTWSGGRVAVTSEGICVDDDLMKLAVVREATVEITTAPAMTADSPCASGRLMEQDDWKGLDALALRTTVPATEQSRAGAGAGNLDND